MKYIVFEGINTVGKSTIINNLKFNFESNTRYIEEPSVDNKLGYFLRKEILGKDVLSMYTKTHLFLLSIRESIVNATRDNVDYLVSSRGVISNIAYSTLEDNTIFKAMDFYSIKKPDLIVFLTINKGTLQDRLQARYTKTKVNENIPITVEDLMKKQEHMSNLLLDLKTTYLSNTKIVTYNTSSSLIGDIVNNVKNDITTL